MSLEDGDCRRDGVGHCSDGTWMYVEVLRPLTGRIYGRTPDSCSDGRNDDDHGCTRSEHIPSRDMFRGWVPVLLSGQGV